MKKQRVFVTGATGGMGFASLKEMLKDTDKQDIVILARDSEKNRKILAPYMQTKGLTIVWGDLNDYEVVKKCVKDCDIVLHIAAFVSPAADYYPDRAMKVNYGSTRNIIRAIYEHKQQNFTRLVYIGTVAETGDRMPPIHWGRVGDPIKPSMFDYYAVSKVAAERLVIESGLKYWVSLRQTGIIGKAMSEINDAIMFHNCFDNVLEYCSDRDSARAMKNLCAFYHDGDLPEAFWGHIYNIGGGPSCRIDTYSATLNFHGHYYLDSDKLENYLHFRHDSMQYYYDCYLEMLGGLRTASRIICKLPGGQKLMGGIMRRKFDKLARTEHGTIHFIEDNVEDHIDAYWGSRARWEALPEKLSDMKHFTDWDKVIPIDHGYDESKPESELDLEDMRQAAAFRGGECLSKEMKKGDLATKLRWKCQFGHEFEASPALILKGGHWCPDCLPTPWNYDEIAKGNPFFAQVWRPFHAEDEHHCFGEEIFKGFKG